jgi:peptidoglycan/xylan/chitin deacetylase (PgdA/CDA1 family)
LTGELRSVALRMVKRAAVAADAIRPPRRGVVILIYHRIVPRSRIEMELPASVFGAQMEILAEEAWVVPLDQALDHLERPDPPDRDPVVVTFDDGTADFLDEAVPILQRHRIPATLYLATNHVEQGRPFPYTGTPISWSGVRDALSTGLVTVGSHTHTHALLDRLPRARIEEELDRSMGLIQDRLGRNPGHFAYPKGVLGGVIARTAVGRRFRSAALGGNRPNPYGRTDALRLSRSPIQSSDGLRWFRRKLRGGLALEESLRGLANRHRYRSLAR